MLATYSPEQAADFIFYLVETEKEEKLEYVWVHSMTELPFEKWKAEITGEKNIERKKINKRKEKEALNHAEEILGKSLREGGATENV